ncbi:hypothetical protein AeMF1_006205, partial [Aphanomyces euteiches]
MAIGAYLYGGIVMSLFTCTPMVAIFHGMWSLFLPSALQYQAIEGYSRGAALWGHRKHGVGTDWQCVAVRVGPHERVVEPIFSSFSYNNMKAFLLLGLTMRRRHPRRCLDGTLHSLFHTNPSYRKMPLFSCRKMPLLFLATVPRTATFYHGTTYCAINHENCATFRASPTGRLQLQMSQLRFQKIAAFYFGATPKVVEHYLTQKHMEAWRRQLIAAIESWSDEDDAYESTIDLAIRPPRRRGGSTLGRRVVQRDRQAAHERIVQDYFCERPIFGDDHFRRRFRM